MRTIPITHETTRPEQQVGDGLVDRHVDRPDLDRRPTSCSVHSEAGLNFSSSPVVSDDASATAGSARKSVVPSVEQPLSRLGLRAEEGDERDGELERVGEPRRGARRRCRRLESATVTATNGMPTMNALMPMPIPLTPAAARLPSSSGSRVSRYPSAWAPTQRTAASAQPLSGQPAIAKTGSASRIRPLPASIGARRPGTGRGVV